MSRISIISEKLKNISEQLKKTILALILTAAGWFFNIFNAVWDGMLKIYPKENISIVHSYKPTFISSESKDSINILVVRFEDSKVEDKKNCFGFAVADRIHRLKVKKKLPINIEYVDSIRSPNEPLAAKNLLKINNAELLIYGLFKRSGESFCDSGSVCFRTTAYNLLESIADSNDIDINKYPDNYSPFYLNDIEKGKFSLDTLAFDSWIQSLYVLKRRGKAYNKYVELYKITQADNDSAKITNYYVRAKLNIEIGNYYDAISDFDSVLQLKAKVLTSFTINHKIRKNTEFIDFMKSKILPFTFEKDSIEKMKYFCYILLEENSFALKKINNELNFRLKPKIFKETINGKTNKKTINVTMEIDLNTGETYLMPIGSNEPKDRRRTSSGSDIDYDVLINQSIATLQNTVVDLSILKSILLSLNHNNSEAESLFLQSKNSKMRDLVYLSALLVYTAKSDKETVYKYLNEAQKEKIDIISIVNLHNKVSKNIKLLFSDDTKKELDVKQFDFFWYFMMLLATFLFYRFIKKSTF